MKKILLSTLALAAVLSSCDNMNNKEAHDELSDATADTAVVARTGETVGAAVDDAGDAVGNAVDVEDWDMLPDMNNVTTYSEVKNPNVKVRGNAKYNVYDVDESVLFDTDKSTLRPSAKDALGEVAASIGQRFSGKKIYVMGFTDARASKDYNKELGRERADAVKNWMVENGKIAADNITAQSKGETNPVATNATAAGRQENRRVEIAVVN